MKFLLYFGENFEFSNHSEIFKINLKNSTCFNIKMFFNVVEQGWKNY